MAPSRAARIRSDKGVEVMVYITTRRGSGDEWHPVLQPGFVHPDKMECRDTWSLVLQPGFVHPKRRECCDIWRPVVQPAFNPEEGRVTSEMVHGPQPCGRIRSPKGEAVKGYMALWV